MADPTGTPARRQPAASATTTAACAATISLAVYAVVRHFQQTSMVDMLVYRAEGAAVVSGSDLYAMRLPGWDLPATYPPFAAMLFVPSTWFEIGTLRVLVMLANTVLLALVALLSFRLVGWPGARHRAAAVLLATGFGVWLEPVFTTLQYGQVNLGILCLVLWDLGRPDRSRSKGVGIGLAVAIKITPGLFAVYLLLTGRIRAAAVSGATFLAATLLGALALPGASYGFWTKYLWDPRRVGVTELVDNQSLKGAVSRLLDTNNPGPAGLAACAVAGLLGLAVAVLAGRSGATLRRAEAWGVVCTALTALLISPISWTHHWVWCLPLLVLLAAEATDGRRRALLGLTLAAFLSYAMWLVPLSRGLGLPWYWQLPSSVYAPLAVALLTVVGLRLHRVRGRSDLDAEAARLLRRVDLEQDASLTNQK
ncbi:glycosyltransferase 87 family protein [Kitasatospora sp. NPDC057015]|uniref:glycosyltransferase 87 family protein n=1 Tax=Kitasatospora sp. NPDC057015 TaxID=3346001 RepID=UPI0036312037